MGIHRWQLTPRSINTAVVQPQQTLKVGKSRGDLTSKIHVAVDAMGLPIEFGISGGEVNDCTAATELLEQLTTTVFFHN